MPGAPVRAEHDRSTAFVDRASTINVPPGDTGSAESKVPVMPAQLACTTHEVSDRVAVRDVASDPLRILSAHQESVEARTVDVDRRRAGAALRLRKGTS
jgi:hypothetical protein